MRMSAPTLDVVYQSGIHSGVAPLSKALVMRVVRAVVPHLSIPAGGTVECGVVVVGPARMRTLNKKWRGKDAPTDVLSFPLPAPAIDGYTRVSLGDLFICPVVVRQRARAWDTTVRYQMMWTVVHGLLHLAGHDHEANAAAAKRMEELEQKILQSL